MTKEIISLINVDQFEALLQACNKFNQEIKKPGESIAVALHQKANDKGIMTVKILYNEEVNLFTLGYLFGVFVNIELIWTHRSILGGKQP